MLELIGGRCKAALLGSCYPPPNRCRNGIHARPDQIAESVRLRIVVQRRVAFSFWASASFRQGITPYNSTAPVLDCPEIKVSQAPKGKLPKRHGHWLCRCRPQALMPLGQ
jgi:hypothetical protein